MVKLDFFDCIRLYEDDVDSSSSSVSKVIFCVGILHLSCAGASAGVALLLRAELEESLSCEVRAGKRECIVLIGEVFV